MPTKNYGSGGIFSLKEFLALILPAPSLETERAAIERNNEWSAEEHSRVWEAESQRLAESRGEINPLPRDGP